MKREDQAVLVVAARWLTPLASLFALSLLANWPPGAGVGVVAGVAMAIPFALNALLFGVSDTLVATPVGALRISLALGVVLAFVSVGLPGLRWNGQLIEAGAFIATSAGLSLALLAVMGRVAALQEGSW